VAAESVAAVVVEPILGEGGFVTPPAEFYPTLSAICRKHAFSADCRESADGLLARGRCLPASDWDWNGSGDDGQVADCGLPWPG